MSKKTTPVENQEKVKMKHDATTPVKVEVVAVDEKKGDKKPPCPFHGSLQHLAAVGIQDQELNVTAEKTVFKEKKKRTTNYAHEWTRVEEKDVSSSFEGDQLCLNWIVPRTADLLNGLVIHILVEEDAFDIVPFATSLPSNTDSPFASYFEPEQAPRQTTCTSKSVELVTASVRVGNYPIETLYGEMETFKGNVVEKIHGIIRDGKSYTLFKVPIRFSTMGTSSSSPLPIISVQYAFVRVKVNLKCSHEVAAFEIWHNFIFLQSEERRHFAQNSHEYVMEQTQMSSVTKEHEQGLVETSLKFNHPCIYLIFTVKDSRGLNVDFRRISAVRLLLNGSVRMQGPGYMFLAQNPGDHPGISTVPQHANTYMIKFKAPNSDHHDDTSLPHGTLNFSMIDDVQLLIKIEGATEGEVFTVDVFCQTINIAVIRMGVMSTKYSS